LRPWSNGSKLRILSKAFLADGYQRLLARLLNVFFLAVEESKYALTVGNSEDGMHGGLVGQRGIGA
jgi:hypothetical protein